MMHGLSLFNAQGRKLWSFLLSIPVKVVAFLQDEKTFYTIILLSAVILLAIATGTSNYVSYPIIFFGSITALFAYQSYKFTKEKFRLDLLDSRKEIHIAIRDFGYVINAKHPLLLLSDQDMNGIDSYKTRSNDEVLKELKAAHDKIDIPGVFLFYGEDVKDCVMNTKAALTMLDLHWESAKRVSIVDNKEIVETINQHFKTLNQASTDIPKLLKPYMYFGQYR